MGRVINNNEMRDILRNELLSPTQNYVEFDIIIPTKGDFKKKRTEWNGQKKVR